MFRKLPGPATILLLLAASAAQPDAAAAWPFGGSKAAAPAKSAPNGPVKASPEERAAAERSPPLVRATFWQRELQTDPSDAQAGLGLASALRALGKNGEAADVSDRMLALYPKNMELLLESARDYLAGGQGFYAIPPLKAAMKLAPKDWRPASLLGLALDQDERPDEAVSAYQQALKLSPDNPAVLSNLALFYATRNDTAQAEALLRRAAAQPSATAKERQNLALILGLEGKTREAEQLMRQDLPPDAADANLTYLEDSKALAAPARPVGAPPAPGGSGG